MAVARVIQGLSPMRIIKAVAAVRLNAEQQVPAASERSISADKPRSDSTPTSRDSTARVSNESSGNPSIRDTDKKVDGQKRLSDTKQQTESGRKDVIPPPASTSSQPMAPSPMTTVSPEVATIGSAAAAASIESSGIGYLWRIVGSLWPSSDSSSSSTPVAQPRAIETPLAKPSKVPQFVSMAPMMNRKSLEERTRALVKKIALAESTTSLLHRITDLSEYLQAHPDYRGVAVNCRIMPLLLRSLRQTRDLELKCKINECLSLVGYAAPPKGKGIRLLSIDGGGTRGMMGLEVLEALEVACGGRLKLHEMFDLVVGVSTGAIIASLLFALKYDIPKCKEIYNDLSVRLFKQGKFSGMRGLLFSHAYYNTALWVEILKEAMGEKTLISTASDINAAKIAIISCVVNTPKLEAFLFRNYHYPPGTGSIYMGSSKYKLVDAIQASGAAPGYFKEVRLDQYLHQDGGVLINNPCAVAVHEARQLWPNSNIQCLVSIGNGRSRLVASGTNAVPLGEPIALPLASIPTSTSLQEKILKIVDSATDTEHVHTTLNDLLPSDSYYRLNPYVSQTYTLDEVDPVKLGQMRNDARMYLRRNAPKLSAAAASLVRQRPRYMRLIDSVKQQLLIRFNLHL